MVFTMVIPANGAEVSVQWLETNSGKNSSEVCCVEENRFLFLSLPEERSCLGWNLLGK